MHRQNMTHHGILFDLKKEGNSDTCWNKDELWSYIPWSRLDRYDFMHKVWVQVAVGGDRMFWKWVVEKVAGSVH